MSSTAPWLELSRHSDPAQYRLKTRFSVEIVESRIDIQPDQPVQALVTGPIEPDWRTQIEQFLSTL